MFEKLPKGEKGIADKGYINHRWADQIYCPIAPKNVNGVKTLTLGEDLYNTTLSSMRIEVERVFGRMKTFKVLTHSRDRNLLRHRLLFVVIANTFNIWNEIAPIRKNENPWIQAPPLIPVPLTTLRSDATVQQ